MTVLSGPFGFHTLVGLKASRGTRARSIAARTPTTVTSSACRNRRSRRTTLKRSSRPWVRRARWTHSAMKAAGALNVYDPKSGKLLATLGCGRGHWKSPIVPDGMHPGPGA
jgi:hypothetical protein